jgi:FKBP-type peptidyl-prolyl cis-trans isomerase FkpA
VACGDAGGSTAPAASGEGGGTTVAGLETEDGKTLYAIGLSIARQLRSLELSPQEIALVQEGMGDFLKGNPPKVDLNVYGPRIETLRQARAARSAEQEAGLGRTFAEEAARAPGAVKTESGLVYLELTPGGGPAPGADATVKVHYQGTLRDGSVFDSSVARGEPATFPLNGVIPCFSEGILKMKVGGKSRLTCPASIAYGDRGAPPSIPPNAVLTFEVELLEIVPAGGTPPL